MTTQVAQIAGETWVVSMAALPLPAGGATSANQILQTAALNTIIAGIPVTNFPGSYPITATSLPLPTGAATAARQDTGNTSLSSIDGKLTIVDNDVKTLLTDTQLRATAVPVSATTLPLPTLAATSTNQATEITSLALIAADLGTASINAPEYGTLLDKLCRINAGVLAAVAAIKALPQTKSTPRYSTTLLHGR